MGLRDMIKKIIFISLIFTTPAFADINLLDEGISQGWGVVKIDCVGEGVACTKSGITGTITSAGAGGASDITISKADPCLFLNGANTDTDHYLCTNDDGGNDDDDKLEFGKGNTPGSNIIFSCDYNQGTCGVGATASTGTNVFHITKALPDSNATFVINNSDPNAAGSINETAQFQFQFAGLAGGTFQVGKEDDFSTTAKRDSFVSLFTRNSGTITNWLHITSAGRIGLATNTKPSADLAWTGTAAREVKVERNSTSSTAGQNLTITAGGAPVQGSISALNATPTAAGSGYIAGETLTISTGGTGGTAFITAVDGSGGVTAVQLLAEGSGYTTGTGKSTTGGSGSGCTLNITTVRASTNQNAGKLVLQAGTSTGTGTNSQIDFNVAAPGSSGTTDNAPFTYMALDSVDLSLDRGTGTGQFTLDGSTGGCIMLRDTDDAGWTECDALDGVLSCSIDSDGVCD